MPKLTESEFDATFDDNIEQAGDDYNPCVDFWDYVDALSYEARDGIQHEYVADYIFYNEVRQIEQIMLRTDRPPDLLVIVLDMSRKRVIGHYLWDVDFEASDWLLDLNPAG
ncbi:MAG TPA: hypothetical protein DEA90_01085 [Opitutae bacterium]|nr:hypothetical protein [Puniceicoccaceae bacterium]HBR92743.1 hypothetical protein [Opitutae bacterium]|tara:strand:+ start:275 stop:607 length:333 start_codon:yes stop_codon:yes gene_type:complete